MPVMSQQSPKSSGGLRSSYHIPLISVCCSSGGEVGGGGKRPCSDQSGFFGARVLNDPLNVTGEKNGQSLNLA